MSVPTSVQITEEEDSPSYDYWRRIWGNPRLRDHQPAIAALRADDEYTPGEVAAAIAALLDIRADLHVRLTANQYAAGAPMINRLLADVDREARHLPHLIANPGNVIPAEHQSALVLIAATA